MFFLFCCLFFFFFGGGGPIRVGVGEGGSKVWGRWVMWGMGCKPRIKGIDKCK